MNRGPRVRWKTFLITSAAIFSGARRARFRGLDPLVREEFMYGLLRCADRTTVLSRPMNSPKLMD